MKIRITNLVKKQNILYLFAGNELTAEDRVVVPPAKGHSGEDVYAEVDEARARKVMPDLWICVKSGKVAVDLVDGTKVNRLSVDEFRDLFVPSPVPVNDIKAALPSVKTR